jgi:acyl-CoA synthetase (AMP-forming)/AMP-acid ligase II
MMSMPNVHTLIEMLAYRARVTPDTIAFAYAERACTFADLWRKVNQFGAYLHQNGINPGDRVVVALPNSHDFFFAFYGTQRMGGIAVPIFPGFDPAHMLAMVKLCEARALVVPAAMATASLEQLKQQAAKQALPVLAVPERVDGTPAAPFPTIRPDDIAFIQYTSGSTGDPKGVQLSHRNLLTNIRQLITGFHITDREIFVSWLPVYHDMGLILKTMVPFYLAAHVILLPTSLRHMHDWLEAIEQHRATFTAAPDFAYRLCLRRIQHPERYDLSSLRVALNAAEPVRSQTIRTFESAFGLRNVMIAGYGLAEATVGVSIWPPQTPMKIDTHGNVSVGRPLPDINLMILRDGQPVGPGDIGEIAIQSPANTRGYYANAEATNSLFWKADIILSGDLGYVDADGDLYIVGRKKNIIIHAGHTVYPEEIAEVMEAVPGVGIAAAVGIDKGGVEGEQVYIFAEVRAYSTSIELFQDLIIAMVQQFQARFGFRPGRVYLVKPNTIPRTYNSKIQHQQLREQYLAGDLLATGQILYPNY